MGQSDKEVELKIPLSNKKEIEKTLQMLGAIFISEVKQIDYLFNPPDSHFSQTSEAFRLRHEVSEDLEKAFLTYKGSATFSKIGHKIREEYEVEVSNFSTMKNILEHLHFNVELLVEKVRRTYHLGDIVVAVDSLPFGDFIELEGEANKSQVLRKKLGLGNIEAIKKTYYDLQKEENKI